MRSVSGWSVASISSTHQLRSSRPSSWTGRATCSFLPSTPVFCSATAACCWRRSSAGPWPIQAGAGVTASRRTPASRRSTALV